MKFVPHDYQKYAIEYIKEHKISAVLLGGNNVITIKNRIISQFTITIPRKSPELFAKKIIRGIFLWHFYLV